MKDAIRLFIEKVRQVEEHDRAAYPGLPHKPTIRTASQEDIARAEQAGFPNELLEFYRECEPVNNIEFAQCIWSINDALIENQDGVPGCIVYPHGFIVFASNSFGDAYCIDTNVTTSEGKHPVVLFSHEVLEEGAQLSEIQPFRLEVANSLEDFLVKFTNETLIDTPLYG